MNTGSDLILLLNCMVLFGCAWVKLCISHKLKSPQVVSALLVVFGSCTLAGKVVMPWVVGNDWLNYGQAAICVAIIIWIASERKTT